MSAVSKTSDALTTRPALPASRTLVAALLPTRLEQRSSIQLDDAQHVLGHFAPPRIAVTVPAGVVDIVAYVPLQNRVDPFGNLVATSARGFMTGNRGILHDDQQHIVRNHLSRAWITCVLSWKGRTRSVMTGRTWTELFFLDEATALAAGHRPCAYCRRADYNEFVAAWSSANPALAPTTGRRAAVVDASLHHERRTNTGAKATTKQQAASLPRGTMVVIDGRIHLVAGQLRLAEWSFCGYGPAVEILDRWVTVLTPMSTVRAIGHGYEPFLHPTAPETRSVLSPQPHNLTHRDSLHP